MNDAMVPTQESRTEKVSIAVTRSEKRAVKALAALRETDESNLCRDMPIRRIVSEYRRLQTDMDDRRAESAETTDRPRTVGPPPETSS